VCFGGNWGLGGGWWKIEKLKIDDDDDDDDDDEDEVCNNSILHNRLINSTVGLRDKVFYLFFIFYFLFFLMRKKRWNRTVENGFYLLCFIFIILNCGANVIGLFSCLFLLLSLKLIKSSIKMLFIFVF
jgi:hypothetical protein